MKNIVIYHADCLDGMGAMWSARQALGTEDTEYHAGKYGADIPNCKGKTVYLVDFSYKRNVIEMICKKAKMVIILDHHKTAYDDLKDFEAPNFEQHFDMDRSGAGITWGYFHEGQERPEIIKYIEDRDLWLFNYPETEAVNSYLRSLDYDYDKFDTAMRKMFISQIVLMGQAILDYRDVIIKDVLKSAKTHNLFGHKDIPVINNCPRLIVSEVLHEMGKETEFACAYWDIGNDRLWSLRSKEDGTDVSAIAKHFGGGGHKHASGMKTVKEDDSSCFEFEEKEEMASTFIE